jgi:acyl carrier protein phosphodiesterase
LNFLAHLYLAELTDESLIGNFLGDFVKGTPESLRERFPEAVIRGIRKHRAIDVFTDSHRTFRKAKALLEPGRRRLPGCLAPNMT